MTAKRNLATVVLLLLMLTLPQLAQVEEREIEELRPVLLVVDVQNMWLPRMAEGDRSSAPDKINEAIALFRDLEYPVIAVYHSDPERGPAPETEEFQFADWVAISEDDVAIVKAEPSAFTDTDLDRVLRDSDRETVFLCGLSATGCVLATYFGAIDRGYMAFLVEEALLSPDSTYTDVIEDICYSMTIEETRKTLSSQQ